MKAPDTIYIPADEPRFSWRSISEKDTDVGYIRADIAFDVASRYESTIEAQKAEIARLREWMLSYGHHPGTCDGLEHECTCGFTAALSEAK